MNVLLLVTNIFIVLEEIYAIIQEYGLNGINLYYYIDRDYNKTEERVNQLKEDIRIFDLQEYEEDKDIEVLVGVSNITDYESDFIRKVNPNKVILVEDGSYDYVADGSKEHSEIKKDSLLYVFRPNAVMGAKYYREVKGFEIRNSIIDKLCEYYKRQFDILNKIEEDAILLFTTPMSNDFGYESNKETIDWVERNYPNKIVYVKKHPRDVTQYNSNKLDLRFCPNNIPGQIICQLVKGKKIFEYPSTITLMTDDDENVTILEYKKLEDRNEDYKRAIENTKKQFNFNIIDSKE